MNRVLIVLVFLVCCAATCSPLYTNFELAGQPGVQDKDGLVKVSLSAGDAHYMGGSNSFTVHFKIVNTTRDTIYVKRFPPFSMRTQNFELSAGDGWLLNPGMRKPAEDAVLAIKPDDSLRAMYSFHNDFHGNYKSFRKMLGKARLFINLHDIELNGKALQFEERELVVEEGKP